MLIVVNRCRSAEPDFAELAGAALAALRARPGFRSGEVGHAVDDPQTWVVVTRWDDVGPWRRALSAPDVRVALAPVLAGAVDEGGAFEVVADVGTRNHAP